MAKSILANNISTHEVTVLKATLKYCESVYKDLLPVIVSAKKDSYELQFTNASIGELICNISNLDKNMFPQNIKVITAIIGLTKVSI